MTSGPPLRTDPTLDTPPRPRRWIPVSLRVLVVVVVLAVWQGIGLYRHYAAFREIMAAGGSVVASNGMPAWLLGIVGNRWVDGFIRVREVYLPKCPQPAALFPQLQRLPEVAVLDLSSTNVTDADMQALVGLNLPALTGIGLEDTEISDQGVEWLINMPLVNRLNLAGTKLTDASLARMHQAGRTDMKILRLERTAITDDGLQHLKSFQQLTYLDLTDTAVTEAGIADLQRALPSLKVAH